MYPDSERFCRLPVPHSCIAKLDAYMAGSEPRKNVPRGHKRQERALARPDCGARSVVENQGKRAQFDARISAHDGMRLTGPGFE